ncbi:MAG: CBS domain-containing protein [Hyphomicrobiales bacterium]|nr:CBS domain-containing protein [Hyphomicrobiales bacterium]
MQAKDLMTATVVTVEPETHVDRIAEILLAHRISAVPVVDSRGAPIGMVSEGDLIGRDDADRDARRSWWLGLLTDNERPSPEALEPDGKAARDVMTAPVITVTETAEAAEIARLLTAHRIKRVPVVRDDVIQGIVSRTDLLRALVPGPAAREEKPMGAFSRLLAGIDEHFHHDDGGSDGPSPGGAPAEARGDQAVNATEFRSLVESFRHHQAEREEERTRAMAEQRKAKVRDLIDHHVDDGYWQGLMHQAREAAERGEQEFMLLRFPSQLCSDGGRAVNVPLPDWPKTLRGEAAEVYLRWEHDLKPHGFHLQARVLDYPGGYPGDIGLVLVWGD